MAKNCAGCTGCASDFNSRACGALHYLGRSSYSCNGCNSCNHCNHGNNCNHCHGNCNSCNSCPHGCNAPSDWPDATTCAGDPLFYTGPCGHRPCRCHNRPCCNCGGCGNNCGNGCGNCGHGCGDHCHCDRCDHHTPFAAEFIAIAPQSECAGGALTFSSAHCDSGMFELCNGGVRINRCGRYIAIYNFASSAGNNAATTLSLSVNGAEIMGSRAFVPPAAGYSTRQAHGQAIFDAQAGDVISLNTSSALTFTDCAGPVASLILLAAGN